MPRRRPSLGPIRLPRRNPFTPASPITSAGLFAGRSTELASGLTILQQAVGGNAVHGLITGARGIGKTSLALSIERIARGRTDYLRLVELDPSAGWRPLMVATVVAQRGQSSHDIATALARQVERERGEGGGRRIDDVQIDLKIARFKLGNIPPSVSDDPALQLVEFLQETLQRERDYPGVLLILDEADRVAGAAGVAGFLKALAELLARSGLTNVCLLLVGTDEVAPLMTSDHESAPRVFRPIHIPPLDIREVAELFEKTLLGTGTRMSPAGAALAATESRGLPYLVQRIGFEAYALLPDPAPATISVSAVRQAVRALTLM